MIFESNPLWSLAESGTSSRPVHAATLDGLPALLDRRQEEARDDREEARGEVARDGCAYEIDGLKLNLCFCFFAGAMM